MRMASSTVFGIVLAVAMFSTGVAVDRLTNVYITNFPLDEQGNLKTTSIQKSKIMLVFNQSLTPPSDPSHFIYLTTVNTTGFKECTVMAKAKGTWSVGAVIAIWVYDDNFGIQTIPVSFHIDTSLETYQPQWGTGYSSKWLHSTSLDIYLQAYNSPATINILLTIAVFLTD